MLNLLNYSFVATFNFHFYEKMTFSTTLVS